MSTWRDEYSLDENEHGCHCALSTHPEAQVCDHDRRPCREKTHHPCPALQSRLLNLPTELSGFIVDYFDVNEPEFWSLHRTCRALQRLLLQRKTLPSHFHQHLSTPSDARFPSASRWQDKHWRDGLVVLTVSVSADNTTDLTGLPELISRCSRLRRLVITPNTRVPSLESLDRLCRALEHHWPSMQPLRVRGRMDPFATGFAASPVAVSVPSDKAREFSRQVQATGVANARKFQLARWIYKDTHIVLVTSHAQYDCKSKVYWKSTNPQLAVIRFRSDVAAHTVTKAFLRRLGYPAPHAAGNTVKLHFPVGGTFRYVDCQVEDDEDGRSSWQSLFVSRPGHLTVAWTPVQDQS